MKKSFVLCIAFAMSVMCSFASDVITLHNGEVIKGKVVVNEPSFVKFTYEGEDVPVSIGKVAISSIKYNSGRVEEGSEKVVINDPNSDYEKVNVFREKDEVIGLYRVKEITAKSGGEFAISDKEGRYIAKTIKKLQKQAAKMGGCAILITSQSGNSASFWKNPHSAMTAIVYKYAKDDNSPVSKNK